MNWAVSWPPINLWALSFNTWHSIHFWGWILQNNKYGYTLATFRNQESRVPRKPKTKPVIFSCDLYTYQLAFIAANRRAELNSTLKRQKKHDQIYEISHLCHNPRCYNIDHLTVETKEQNRVGVWNSIRICFLNNWFQKRSECQGQVRLFYYVDSDSAIWFHPCRHDVGANRKRCILPLAYRPLVVGQITTPLDYILWFVFYLSYGLFPWYSFVLVF